MTDHPESLYQFASPSTPKGYWIIEKHSFGFIQFAMYKKPNRLHRLMAKFLLGWDWQDNV